MTDKRPALPSLIASRLLTKWFDLISEPAKTALSGHDRRALEDRIERTIESERAG